MFHIFRSVFCLIIFTFLSWHKTGAYAVTSFDIHKIIKETLYRSLLVDII